MRTNQSGLIGERIERRESVLDAVENVFRMQKGKLETRPELVRIEDVRHYDHRLVEQSLKDPRLFGTRENGSILPERMYDSVPQESFDTYENRFAASVLDSITDQVKEAIGSKHADESLPFLSSPVSFGRFGTFSLLRSYLNDYDRSLKEERTANLSSLSRRAEILHQSEVYRGVRHVKFTSVEPTNLLLEQPDYRTILQFYMDGVAELSETGKTFKTALKMCLKNFLQAEENDGFLEARRGDIEYRLRLGDTVSVTLRDGTVRGSYSLGLVPSLFHPRLEVSNGSERRVLPLLEGEDLADLIQSLMLILPAGDRDICPVCEGGLKRGHCPICGADISIDESGRRVVTNVPFLQIGG